MPHETGCLNKLLDSPSTYLRNSRKNLIKIKVNVSNSNTQKINRCAVTKHHGEGEENPRRQAKRRKKDKEMECQVCGADDEGSDEKWGPFQGQVKDP